MPQTEPLSIWALVVGIVSFFICGLVGGIAALILGSRAKKAIDSSGGAKGGRTMAVIGQVLGVLDIVVSIVLGAVIIAFVVLVSHRVSYSRLVQGDCYNRDSGGLFANRVTRASCTSPHLSEVVTAFAAPDGPWPGRAGIGAIAGTRCDDAARQYSSALPAGVGVYYLYPPNRRSWDSGNRIVVCEVHNRDGTKRVGSLRSS